MLPSTFNIGPLTIHLYGIILAISILAGWLLARKRSLKYKIPQLIFDDPILLIPLVLSLIGARAYHVIDYWNIYNQNPVSVLYVGNGGLGIWGALIGLFIGFWLTCKLRKLSFLNALDLISPSILLGQAIGRIGNFINQEGFGPPTNLSWGVYISEDKRPLQFIASTHFHPTFFYEAIIDLLFFALLLYLSSKFKIRGQVFALYLILYSAGRFVIEFWRIDTATVGAVKVAQILSIVAFIIGVVLFLSKKSLTTKKE